MAATKRQRNILKKKASTNHLWLPGEKWIGKIHYTIHAQVDKTPHPLENELIKGSQKESGGRRRFKYKK